MTDTSSELIDSESDKLCYQPSDTLQLVDIFQ